MSRSSDEDPEKLFSSLSNELSELVRSVGNFDTAQDELLAEFVELFQRGISRRTQKDIFESIDHLRAQFVVCVESVYGESSEIEWRIQTIFHLMVHEEQLRLEELSQLAPFPDVPYDTYDKDLLLSEITKYCSIEELTDSAPIHLGNILKQAILSNLTLIFEQAESGESAQRAARRRVIGKNVLKATALLSGASAAALLARYIFS